MPPARVELCRPCGTVLAVEGLVKHRRMHVLVAAHDFYPDPRSGGTGRYVYETARRLVGRGHQVSVLTRRRGDVPERESIEGIAVYRYDVSVAETPAHRVLTQLPDAVRAVAHHYEAASDENIPDVLHFQGPVTSLLVSRIAPKSIPAVCTFHSPWPTEYRLRTRDAARSSVRRELNARVRWLLERRVLGRSARVVTLSEFMRAQLRRTYGAGRSATVVPGGVDLDRFTPNAGDHPPVAHDGPIVLTVRRLSPRMGHEVLLEAFAAISDDVPGPRLVVVGDGPARQRLQRRARTLGIADRTSFLGYVPDGDLPTAYATADVFVLPTTELEGFGLATLEALASGTPVVGTTVGATPEVLGPLADAPEIPTSILVEAGDAEALAARLRAWTTLPDRVRERAGRTCRLYVRERYPWSRTVDGLESVYRNAIDA